MAISKKGKRRIHVNGRNYLWWVHTTFEYNVIYHVYIAPEINKYHWKIKYSYTSESGDFDVLNIRVLSGKYQIETKSPIFTGNENGTEKIITPRVIRAILEYCMEEDPNFPKLEKWIPAIPDEESKEGFEDTLKKVLQELQHEFERAYKQ